MISQEFLQKIKDEELEGIVLINDVTTEEFLTKWKEFITKYNNRKTVWSEIFVLYDCELAL